VIQHVVDEAREAGIEHFIFVTGRNKAVIEDHFDKQFELEATLQRRGKNTELHLLDSDLPGAGQTSFTRQQEPLGLGHAVWCARELVGHEPFALLLPDMLHHGQRGCLAGMMDVHRETGGNIIGVYEVPREQVSQYGIVGAGETRGAGFRITSMVEKPKPADAPSNYAISGRYILQPDIFALLENQATGAGGEIQLTDSMLTLAKSQPFFGYRFDGRIFDCGSKIGFLTANVAYALARDDIEPEFRTELKALLG
jgi:UTP--glucose-1-phosphate uridylyltransferase